MRHNSPGSPRSKKLRARLDVEPLETRTPVSEGIGPVVTVFALAGAGSAAAVAQTAPPPSTFPS